MGSGEGARILIVEDDQRLRRALAVSLESAYDVSESGGLAEATARLQTMDPDLVIADLRLGDGSGLQVLKIVKARFPDTPVVMMTAFGSVDAAVEAMTQGAYHFVVKPFPMEQFRTVVARALESRRLHRENVDLKERVREAPAPELVGQSQAIRDVLALVEKVSPARSTVLITGESGTGKEIVAQLIARRGPRASQRLVRVNCAALPADLLEAELFGYRKGAFTGAGQDHRGRFEMGHLGTLFLDEVSTLDYRLQAKLLNAIQEGLIHPLGSEDPVKVDVRILAATNQDLRQLVAEGKFREDLFFRLNVFPIQIPPLRERIEDVPELTDHLLRRLCRRLGRSPVRMDRDAVELLKDYDWPGNVRELENFLERAIIMTPGDRIEVEFLACLSIDGVSRLPGVAIAEGDLHMASALHRVEQKLVREALKRSGGMKKDAARLLGISARMLTYYLRKHRIES